MAVLQNVAQQTRLLRIFEVVPLLRLCIGNRYVISFIIKSPLKISTIPWQLLQHAHLVVGERTQSITVFVSDRCSVHF